MWGPVTWPSPAECCGLLADPTSWTVADHQLLPHRGSPVGLDRLPPLSITTPATGQIIWILSVLLLGGSSIFGGINFIATILKLRRPGLKLMQLPMYCWAMLGTSILVVLSTPVLAGTLVLLSFDIVAHTGFSIQHWGNVVVYQHLFWFYSIPPFTSWFCRLSAS